MPKSRITASALSAALVIGALSIPALQANPAFADDTCTDAKEVRILNFNDFHGRIAASGPDTSVFFASLNELRNDNTLVVSGGDNVGATIFTSMVQNDEPTLALLNAAKVDVSTIGNHELDKGYADLERITKSADFPYVSANLTLKDGTIASPDGAYRIFERNGVRIAVIGAVTAGLPDLIAPSTFDTISVSDPVAAVNRFASQIKSSGQADIVVAAYHEGAPLPQYNKQGEISTSLGGNEDNSEAFRKISQDTNTDVDVILNAHTHVAYAYVDGKRPIVQSGNYAEWIGQIDLTVGKNAQGKTGVCQVSAQNVKPKSFKTGDKDAAVAAQAKADRDAYVAANAPAEDAVVKDAIAKAAVLGQPVLAKAEQPITRAKKADGAEDRGSRSELSDMVAQMFYEEVGGSAAGTVGIQNPGGTRADLVPNEAGELTYAQVASVLPFANTVMTTEITGAQFKTLLEQQWMQPETSSRPVLMLGLSNNVAYSYDESRDKGDRVTAIEIDGKPVDPNAFYTVVSGSFLIQGGDNFTVLKNGRNTADTGRADLEAWSNWVKAQGTLKPFPRAELKGAAAPAEEAAAGEAAASAKDKPAKEKPAKGSKPSKLPKTGVGLKDYFKK